MSAAFTHLVWTRSKAPGARKLVLLALADHADRNGESQLSARELATLCCMSKSTVENHIAALEKAGELRKMAGASGPGNASRYWITLRGKAEKRPPAKAAATDAAISTPPPADTVPHMAGMDWCLPNAAETPEVSAAPALPVQATEETMAIIAEAMAMPPHLIEPKKPEEAAPAPTLDITQHEVNRVLDEAGIMPPENQPFYWCRREHRYDLHALLDRRSMDVVQLCAAISAGKAEGRKLDRPARQIADIEALLPRRMMV